MSKIKLFLLIFVIVLIYLFFFMDGMHYFSPGFFKSLYNENSLLTAVVFFISYVALTGLSLPGAAILTLICGYIFGFLPALVMVSFASTIGATLAFILSRVLLRDWVQARFSSYMETINNGIIKDGAFYLFTLRLIPIVPFFVINLVMGLMPVRIWTFYWVSQIGMLAGTVVYVNAGSQVAKIDEISVGGILTPELLASFALLGIFPLLVRKGVSFFKGRRAG